MSSRPIYPLKSAMSIVNVYDTSLALPSTSTLHRREQRVVEQVTIKRRRSRGKSGSTPVSPTSPPPRFYDPPWGPPSGKGDSSITSSDPPITPGVKSPDFGVRPPINPFDPGSNGNEIKPEDPGSDSRGSEMTMKKAVEFLSKDDETYKHYGASYIQHYTFIDEEAKEEVYKLNGVSPLVSLLRSPSAKVNQTASAALRNMSFESNTNKMEIHRCGGIADAVALLRETDSVETQQQLTGLLWNLSSVDSLKPDMVQALPVLMERVILPHTTGSAETSSSSKDPEVFLHTTECLRNVSSKHASNRNAMRGCRGLVDSLVSYVQGCVEAGNPDDKPVENCVCILHNLTFQLEEEVPALFNRFKALIKTDNKSKNNGLGPIACFDLRGKSSELELARKRSFEYPEVEDPHPQGAGWLIHSTTLQTYLTLLGSSQIEETQEASCGAMQNLTTHEGIVSSVMSQMIVNKLDGLKVLCPLLNSNKVTLQKNSVALVGNLSRNPNLHHVMVRNALPELLSLLSAGTTEGNESDDTLAMACQTANCLLMKEPESGKHLINNNLINALTNLSQNEYFPKSKKSAAVLLYNLWSERDLQSFVKKQGMSKASFVNDVTTAAYKSVQIID